ncbi:MAG: polyprenyl synthetase family protein [Candidatus Zixiibacteriota bacterium]
MMLSTHSHTSPTWSARDEHSCESEIELVNQMSDYVRRKAGKGYRTLIAREIAAVLSPGTAIPSEILECLESLHTFTLIHDDVVDNSPMRRGQDTLWKQYSKDLAILYGDYQHAFVFQRLAESRDVPESFRIPLIEAFASASMRVQEGQIAELQHLFDVRMDQLKYYKIASLKTSSLISLSVFIGAIFGQACESAISELMQFADYFGIAYQIYNDIIDFTTSHGKCASDDIRSGVMSLPLIIYCDSMLRACGRYPSLEMSASNTQIREAVVTDILRLNILQQASSICRMYSDDAEYHLKSALQTVTAPTIGEILCRFRGVLTGFSCT